MSHDQLRIILTPASGEPGRAVQGLTFKTKVMERNAPMTLHPAIYKVMKRLFKVQEERKATIFFEIYGHVQQVSVRIYKGEWEPDKDASFSDNLYIDSSLEDNIRHVEDFVNSIDNYINNHL